MVHAFWFMAEIFVNLYIIARSSTKYLRVPISLIIIIIHALFIDWNWRANSGTTHASSATFANHQSPPRSLFSTKGRKFVVLVSIRNSPKNVTSVKRFFARAEWRVEAPSSTAIVSNVRFATHPSPAKRFNRKKVTDTVCRVINSNTPRNVLVAIVTLSTVNITQWTRIVGTRSVSNARCARTYFNNNLLYKRMERSSWYVRAVFKQIQYSLAWNVVYVVPLVPSVWYSFGTGISDVVNIQLVGGGYLFIILLFGKKIESINNIQERVANYLHTDNWSCVC